MIILGKYLNFRSLKSRFKFLIILCYTIIYYTQSFGQQVDEYTIKSVFILKLPAFVEWPDNAYYRNVQNNFVIGIIGSDPFKGKLQAMIKSERLKMKGKDIILKHITRNEEIEGTDLLFVANSEKYTILKIIKEIQHKPILTISDTKSFVDKGLMINLYIENEKLAFDVNLKQSNLAGIYISSKFLIKAGKVIK